MIFLFGIFEFCFSSLSVLSIWIVLVFYLVLGVMQRLRRSPAGCGPFHPSPSASSVFRFFCSFFYFPRSVFSFFQGSSVNPYFNINSSLFFYCLAYRYIYFLLPFFSLSRACSLPIDYSFSSHSVISARDFYCLLLAYTALHPFSSIFDTGEPS